MEEVIEILLKFLSDHEWEEFYNPKDLVNIFNMEAGELLEHIY